MNEYLKKVKAEWLSKTAKSNVTISANEELISVIIPLYNQGRFLEETILSVINQTYKNWEIVIVNDCSTDDSLEIAQKLCQKYSSFAISVHSNSINSGVSATRNNAIRQCRGKYFIPLDSDDKIAPTFMQKCMQTMLESGVDIVYVDVQEFGEQNNMVPSVEFDPVRLLFMNYIAICSLVKKVIWERVGGYEERLK